MSEVLRGDEPTREEALKFLQVVDKLCCFEAEQRQIRHWGIFKTEELPIPEVVSTITWLNTKFNISNEEIQSWRQQPE